MSLLDNPLNNKDPIQFVSQDVLGERYLLGAGPRSAQEILSEDIFRTPYNPGTGTGRLTPDWARNNNNNNEPDPDPDGPGLSTVQKAVVGIAGFALFSALVGQLFTFEVGS